MEKEEPLFRYHFVSIDEECEKWALTSQNDACNDSPPCFAILNQFYDELMIPTFPLEEERDDLNDWLECFRFQMKQRRWKEQSHNDMHAQELSDEDQLLLQGNAMDVVLIIADTISTESKGSETEASIKRKFIDRRGSSFAGLYAPTSTQTDDGSLVIIGAAAVEYYKQSRVGLLSYIVLHSDFRGRGYAAPLHEEALSRMKRLACMYNTSNDPTTPLMQAIFAETNTAAAGDVTPEQSLLRHKALYKLGYRLVDFPYAQPPLSTEDVDASFDDLLLLVYFPFRDDLSACDFTEVEVGNFYSWFRTPNDASVVRMDVNIPFSYVEDFYKSVFGYNSLEESSLVNRDDIDGIPDYRSAKYFKLANWFSLHHCSSGLVEVNLCGPPWEDCKNALYLEMEEWKKINVQSDE